MKKLFATFFSALVIVSFCACATTSPSEQPIFRTIPGDRVLAQAQVSDWSFEDAVVNSTNIAIATFKGYEKTEGGLDYELKFEVNDELRGKCGDTTIYVYVSPSHWVNDSYEEYNFIENQEYLLVLEKHISVNYEHDQYLLLGNIFAPVSYNVGVYMRYQRLAQSEYGCREELARTDSVEHKNDLLAYVETLCDSSDRPTEPIGIPYTNSTEVSDIIRESEFVLQVVPREELQGHNDILICDVIQKMKGNYDVPQRIYLSNATGKEIVFGDVYYAALNRADGPDSSSIIFVVSSKNSLFNCATDVSSKIVENELLE
mgnify:CR=1 FL=1